MSISLIRGRATGTDIDVSNRVRLVSSLNPYMADNPDVLQAMAAMPMSMDQLAANASGTYSMMLGDRFAAQLEAMSPGAQRAVWETLPKARQMALSQLGYQRPEDPKESWIGQMLGPVDEIVGGIMGGFNKAAMAVGKPVFHALDWLGSQPAHIYRTIRTMDERNQWQAAVGATVGVVGALATRNPNAGTLAQLNRIGLYGLAGGAFGAAATNPIDFAQAFQASANGERTFKRSAIQRADELLGDPRIITLAREVADAEISVEELAYEMAGLRQGSANAELAKLQEIVGKYAQQGTPEYEQVFKALYDTTQDDTFREAVQELRNGKISPGRDVADLFFDPGEAGYTWVSGAVDAAWTVAVDPTLIATELVQFDRARRLGMQGLEGSQAATRFLEIQASQPKVRRLHEVVAHAVDTEDFELMRQMAPSFSSLYLDLIDHKRTLATLGELPEGFGLDEFNEYITTATKMKPIMQGVGTVAGADGVLLKGLGKGTERWKQLTVGARRFTEAMSDPRFEEHIVETARAMLRDAGEVDDATIAAMADDDLLRAAFPSSLYGKVSPTGELVMPWHAASLTAGQRVGRTLGRTWIGHQLGEVLTSITTMIPPGNAISLVDDVEKGLAASNEIPKLVELSRLMGMPAHARRQWTNLIMNAKNPGERMRLINGWLDNALTIAGAKTNQHGRDIVEKILERNRQAYAAGGVDTFIDNGIARPVALLPSHQALKVVMPDLHAMRKAARSGHMVDFLGFSELPLIEAAMTKVWKPAVLLRVSFIPRAAGEEFMNLMLRGGLGHMGQELGARTLGRRDVIQGALDVERTVPLTPLERELLQGGWTGLLPGHLKPFGKTVEKFQKLNQAVDASDQAVLRMMARYRWTDPMQRKMLDYAEWYSRQLREGVRPAAFVGRKLEGGVDRVAGMVPETVQIGRRQISARANVSNNLKSLFAGNQHSWRRMLVGGVDDQLVRASRKFYALHSRAVMGEISAVNAGPISRDGDRTSMQVVPTLQDGVVRAEEFMVVRGHFQRIVDDDPRFLNALHESLASVVQDPVIQRIIASEVARIKGVSVAMSEDQLAEVVDLYHYAINQDLGLKLVAAELASGAPSRDSYMTMLHNLASLDDRPHGGQLLAERLRDAFPTGVDAPSWAEHVEPVLRSWGAEIADGNRRDTFLEGVDALGRVVYQLDNADLPTRRFAAQLLRGQETGWRVRGADIRAGMTPTAPRSLTDSELADRRVQLAELDRDIAVHSTVERTELQRWRDERIAEIDREARDMASEMERLGATVDHATGKPTFPLTPKRGAPEWEWWYQLQGRQRQKIARTYFREGNIPVDVFASEAGMSVDDWGRQLIRLTGKHDEAVAARAAMRRRTLADVRDDYLSNNADLAEMDQRRTELANVIDAEMGPPTAVELAAPAGPKVFHDSWVDAEPVMIDRLTAALLDANNQDATMQSLRLAVVGDGGRALTSGQTQLYVPTRVWHPDGAPVTFDDILRNVDDRRVIMANEALVMDYLDALQNDPAKVRTLMVADPQLAHEIGKAGARMRGATYDPGSLRVVDMDRAVLDGRAAEVATDSWMRPLAKDPADRRVEATGWDVSTAAIERRLRPMDATQEEKAREWAESVVAMMRQRMTRGTRERLTARRRTLRDGTDAPLVYRRGVDGELVEVPAGEVVEHGEYLNRKGKRIVFGDTDYFTSAAVEVDDTGDVMWELLGPMVEDMYDDLANFPRLLPKDNDAVRVYRSNVRHVRDAGSSVPNYATAEMLAYKRESWWDRTVRYGFDKVIGPSLDAIVRRPMGFHYFAQRYAATEKWLDGFTDPGIRQGLEEVVARLKPADPAAQAEALNLMRHIAANDGHAEAMTWSLNELQAFVRGTGREEFAAMLRRARSSSNRDAVNAAERLFDLQPGSAAANIAVAADATVDDFVARLEAAIPEEAWASRRDLQRFARDQFGDLEVKITGRRARDQFDDGGVYVVFTKDHMGRRVTTGETVTGKQARQLDPHDHTFAVLEPGAYRTPELEARGMDVETPTIMQGDQRIVARGPDGRPVGPSQPRWENHDGELVDLYDPEQHITVGLVRPPRADATNYTKGQVFDVNGDLVAQGVTPLAGEELQTWAAAQAKRDGLDPAVAVVLDDRVADLLLARRRERAWIEEQAGQHAAIAAVYDAVPFIDSHEFRTQFAETGKGLLPFWYAEENFLKRWGRTLINEGPAVIRKAQLGYMGLKSAGVVRTDEQGKDWFVYPGSGLLAEAIAKIPGVPDTLPVSMMLQSPTESMLPGMSSKFGTPSFSPLVSMPMTLLTAAVPELESTKRAMLGDYGAGRNVVEQFVPAWLVNTFDAIRVSEGNARYSSAQLSAIAQLEANGRGLPDNATPGEQQEFLDRVRNHARVILLAQALSGFFTPGPASQFYVEQEKLFGVGAQDIAQQFSAEYQTLIQNLGVEAGTEAYLAAHPDADVSTMMAYTVGKTESASGAPLVPSEQSLEFYNQHEDYFVEFPDAAPWLLPQGGDNVRSMYAYDQQLNSQLRRRRTPEEFLAAMKFKEASGPYFELRSQYLTQLDVFKANGQTDMANLLTDRWESWAATYKAAHPLFRDQLDSSDGRIQRRRTLDQMRLIVNDPGAPQADHFPALKQLIGYWDRYLIRKSELSEDQTARGREQTERFKSQFETAINSFVGQNPAVRSFWLSVLRPEGNFD